MQEDPLDHDDPAPVSPAHPGRRPHHRRRAAAARARRIPTATDGVVEVRPILDVGG